MKQKLCAGQPSVDLSTTSIARALDGQLVTMKKLQDCPAQRNSPRVKRDRVQYAEWYLQQAVLPVTTLIYVDETCFNLFTKRSRGRAVAGQPAIRQLQYERGRNLNLVMAVAVAAAAGVVYFELQQDTMTGQHFQNFMDNLEQILVNMGADMVNTFVVMDNAPVHRGAHCGEARIKFLPAYSLFHNPIEKCFSIFKMKIREILLKDDTVQRQVAVLPAVAVATLRLEVLRDISSTIFFDQSTISGEKVPNMKNHVMTYMRRCSTNADISY